MQQDVIGHKLALIASTFRLRLELFGVQPTQLCERRGQLLVVELLAPLGLTRVQQAERAKARENVETRDSLQSVDSRWISHALWREASPSRELFPQWGWSPAAQRTWIVKSWRTLRTRSAMK